MRVSRILLDLGASCVGLALMAGSAGATSTAEAHFAHSQGNSRPPTVDTTTPINYQEDEFSGPASGMVHSATLPHTDELPLGLIL